MKNILAKILILVYTIPFLIAFEIETRKQKRKYKNYIDGSIK